MANRNTDFFNVIKVIDIDSLKTMAKFTCAQCINRTKCRRHLKEKKNCEVSCKLFNSGVYMHATLEAYIDTQFYITNDLIDKTILTNIIDSYRKTSQCRN